MSKARTTTSAEAAAAQPEARPAAPLLLAPAAVVHEVEEVGVGIRVLRGVAGEPERPLLAPGLREDREVVQHRELGRQRPEGRRERVAPGSERVTDRGREHRRQEDARRQQAGEREPRPAPRRHQEQEARQDSQEVAVADRSAAAVPVVRDDPDVGEPRQGDRDDAEPPDAIARADHEKEPERDERREEVGEHAAEAAEPEVAEVEQQRLADLARVARRPARGGHLLFVLPCDERPDLVGRHPDAGVVERDAPVASNGKRP